MADETPLAQDRAASIVRDGLDVLVTQGKRLHERSVTKPRWSPEDIVGDTTDLMEHLTPLVERAITLGLELMRPWAAQYESRVAAAAGRPPAAPVVVTKPADPAGPKGDVDG